MGAQRQSSELGKEPSMNGAKRKRSQPEDEQVYEWGKKDAEGRNKAQDESFERERPTLMPSGLLGRDRRRHERSGVAVEYEPPADGRACLADWRLYIFKDGKPLDDGGVVPLREREWLLFGRDRRVADVATDHGSCSKQHAVLQFRISPSDAKEIAPWLMDLETTNGTFLNSSRIDARRYYQLMDRDVVQFGSSSREYVLIYGGISP